jgi:hypothetical protein
MKADSVHSPQPSVIDLEVSFRSLTSMIFSISSAQLWVERVSQTVAKEGVSLDEALENIDIGGPSMIRASAKISPASSWCPALVPSPTAVTAGPRAALRRLGCALRRRGLGLRTRAQGYRGSAARL